MGGIDHSYILELNTPTEEKLSANETASPILDLSKKGLKKVPKPNDGQNVRVLILDENDLQKIDNIDSYLRIEKVTHWVCVRCNVQLAHKSIRRLYGQWSSSSIFK